MGKYPISPEFSSFDRFTPPISRPFLALARTFMGVPRSLFRDPDLRVETERVRSADGAEIELLLLRPANLPSPAPCLFYAHGGGFVLKAAPYHYSLAARYAKSCMCLAAFVQYRLAPKHPFPAPFEDCFAAYTHLLDSADRLNIDPEDMGVGGDSAGAALAVGTAMMLRDRGVTPLPRFQMLPYPFLDASNESVSARTFTDTPMWNSRLSAKVTGLTRPDRSRPEYAYYSPAEAADLSALPPAYIETAEFDCLRDDGLKYAARLRALGIPVELRQTRGTPHGYDIVGSSPVTRESVARRIDFMKRNFKHGNR